MKPITAKSVVVAGLFSLPRRSIWHSPSLLAIPTLLFLLVYVMTQSIYAVTGFGIVARMAQIGWIVCRWRL